jgi:signal transduction histidine kinase
MSAQHSPRYLQLVSTQEDVFADWLEQVRTEIPYACSISRPALVNTLPLFFEHLVLTTVGEGKPFDHSPLAAEHGGQRARVTRFNAGSIVHEFQLFRSAIISAWHRAGIRLELDEVERLNNAIDEALRESLTGFSLSQVQIREQFFSALTHDLRTPLAAASVAVQLIHGMKDPARVRQIAAIAMRQHATLDTMIRNLLDMMVLNAGTTALEVTEAEVYELVSEAVTSVSFSSGRELRLAGERIHGKWNAVAIRRAVENLLNNAVKYSDKDTPIDVVVAVKDGTATIAVANTGPPIPADQTEAIFQLFRRAPGDKEKGIAGWGIGLPYVRTVAEQHGGRVTVDSDGARTTFLLALPLDHIDDADR